MIHGHWVRLRLQVVSSKGLLRQNTPASWNWQHLLSTGWVWSWPSNILLQSVFLMDSVGACLNFIPKFLTFLQSSSLTFLAEVPLFPPFLNCPEKDLVWVSGPLSSWLTPSVSASSPVSWKGTLELGWGEYPPESLVTSAKSSLFDYLISAFILMF